MKTEPKLTVIVSGQVHQYSFDELLKLASTLPDSERRPLCSDLLLFLVRLVELKQPIDLQKRVNAVMSVLGPEPPEIRGLKVSGRVEEAVNEIVERIVKGGRFS
jgi:hypothetical protein